VCQGSSRGELERAARTDRSCTTRLSQQSIDIEWWQTACSKSRQTSGLRAGDVCVNLHVWQCHWGVHCQELCCSCRNPQSAHEAQCLRSAPCSSQPACPACKLCTSPGPPIGWRCRGDCLAQSPDSSEQLCSPAAQGSRALPVYVPSDEGAPLQRQQARGVLFSLVATKFYISYYNLFYWFGKARDATCVGLSWPEKEGVASRQAWTAQHWALRKLGSIWYTTSIVSLTVTNVRTRTG
jgi:hypothetical protein